MSESGLAVLGDGHPCDGHFLTCRQISPTMQVRASGRPQIRPEDGVTFG